MSSTEHEPSGHVEYTEGPELPADTLATYTYTALDQPGRSTVTHYVPFRVWRLEDDGNNYLASQIQVTNKTYGMI